jgi:hypothetical protein
MRASQPNLAAIEPKPPGAPCNGPVSIDTYCCLPIANVMGVPSAAVAA